MKRKIIICISILSILLILGLLYQSNRHNKKIDLSEEGIIFGSDTTKNVMIIFTSFTCEKCELLSKNIHDYISEKIKDGKLKVIYKYTNKEFYSVSSDAFYNFDKLSDYYFNKELYYEDISKSVNLSFEETDKRQKMYDIIQEEIDKCDIDILPTFFINGKKYVGDYSEEQFKRLFE